MTPTEAALRAALESLWEACVDQDHRDGFCGDNPCRLCDARRALTGLPGSRHNANCRQVLVDKLIGLPPALEWDCRGQDHGKDCTCKRLCPHCDEGREDAECSCAGPCPVHGKDAGEEPGCDLCGKPKPGLLVCDDCLEECDATDAKCDALQAELDGLKTNRYALAAEMENLQAEHAVTEARLTEAEGLLREAACASCEFDDCERIRAFLKEGGK